MEPIFVAGCGRSGTTLLAALLASHRRVVAPPEAPFLAEGLVAARRADGGYDLDELARGIGESWRYRLWELPVEMPEKLAGGCSRPAELMAGLATAFAGSVGEAGADRWVDHTPANIGYAPSLLTEFETARMVHIVRDPRAVVASVLPLDWGPVSAREGARWWLSWIGLGLAAELAFPERVLRVSYESLVTDPEGTLRDLLPFLGLELETGMLGSSEARVPAYTREQHALVGRPPDPSRIDAWRSSLPAAQIATIEGELREAAAMLGYEPAAPSAVTRRSPHEFVSTALQTVRQRRRRRSRIRRALKQCAA